MLKIIEVPPPAFIGGGALHALAPKGVAKATAGPQASEQGAVERAMRPSTAGPGTRTAEGEAEPSTASPAWERRAAEEVDESDAAFQPLVLSTPVESDSASDVPVRPSTAGPGARMSLARMDDHPVFSNHLLPMIPSGMNLHAWGQYLATQLHHAEMTGVEAERAWALAAAERDTPMPFTLADRVSALAAAERTQFDRLRSWLDPQSADRVSALAAAERTLPPPPGAATPEAIWQVNRVDGGAHWWMNRGGQFQRSIEQAVRQAERTNPLSAAGSSYDLSRVWHCSTFRDRGAQFTVEVSPLLFDSAIAFRTPSAFLPHPCCFRGFALNLIK